MLASKFSTIKLSGTELVTLLIVIASSRPDHRKSKFGLRHEIKLIDLYCMTKSDF
jgi:hypothetical protein